MSGMFAFFKYKELYRTVRKLLLTNTNELKKTGMTLSVEGCQS